MWAFFICCSWTAAALLWWINRRYGQQEINRVLSSEQNDEALPVASGEGKELRRRSREDPWLQLSLWCEALDDPKTPVQKLMARIYKKAVQSQLREASSSESGDEGMIVGVVRLRHLVRFGFRKIALTLMSFPFILFLLLNPQIWLSLLIRSSSVSEVAVGNGNTAFYEWHTVSGTKRAVPYCTHYDRASEIYQEEIRHLLNSDMLNDETPHPRCILRLDEHTFTFGKDYKKFTNLPSLRHVLELPEVGGYDAVANSYNLTDTLQSPMVYILRDGSRYLRLAVRTMDGKHVVLSLVSEQDILGFLTKWSNELIAEGISGPADYCVCPVFMGILDDIIFYFDKVTSKWEMWLQPVVTSVNVLSKNVKTRMRYFSKVSLFPHDQNEKFFENLIDPTGNEHRTRHRETITVNFIDLSTLRVPDDLDARERHWLGHGTVKRIHESSLPFALTVPLTNASHGVSRVITGLEETSCFYHCRHVLDVLKQTNVK